MIPVWELVTSENSVTYCRAWAESLVDYTGLGLKTAINTVLDALAAEKARADKAEAERDEARAALEPFVLAWKVQLAEEQRLPKAWRVSISVNNDIFQHASRLLWPKQ